MSNDAHIEALRAADYNDAADLLEKLTPTFEKLAAPANPQAERVAPTTPGEKFRGQIEAARAKSGWVNIPLTDDQGNR